jgi:hypothetical protein
MGIFKYTPKMKQCRKDVFVMKWARLLRSRNVSDMKYLASLILFLLLLFVLFVLLALLLGSLVLALPLRALSLRD